MFSVYRLTLPSGGVVRVRKPATAQLLAVGATAFPLLRAALEIAQPLDDEAPLPLMQAEADTLVSNLRGLASLALYDAPDFIEYLTVADLYNLTHWAMTEDVGDAIPDGTAEWIATDFLPFIRSQAAILIDKVAERYGLTPSALIQVPAPLQIDFNLAVGYRGLRRANDGASGEVEVDDVWGNVHKVPASWLPTYQTEPGTRIIRPERVAAHTGKSMTFTAGGSNEGVTTGTVK